MDSMLVKRIKSLLWRAGMMGLATVIAVILEDIQVLELSPLATTITGLVLGEISKYLNSKAD